ncbi:uncharacterized [Tachysurus ichikawai]
MVYTGMNQFNRISSVRIFSALGQQMASRHRCKAAREHRWSAVKTDLCSETSGRSEKQELGPDGKLQRRSLDSLN